MSVYQEMSTAMPHDLVNAKPVMAAIREFFGSSQLSQFMTRPTRSAKSRTSAAFRTWPGGLSRERAGFEVATSTRRTTAASARLKRRRTEIGLISSLSCFARINDYGFIESPYRKVKGGRIIDYVQIVNAGDSEFKAGEIVEQTKSRISTKSSSAVKSCTSVLLLSLGLGRRQIRSVAQANVSLDDV